jgi:hypothetical protein
MNRGRRACVRRVVFAIGNGISIRDLRRTLPNILVTQNFIYSLVMQQGGMHTAPAFLRPPCRLQSARSGIRLVGPRD